MRWWRVLVVWGLIVLAETLQGMLRQLWLVPWLGELPARQLGVVSGALLILLITWATRRWLRLRTPAQQLQAGALWLLLMLLFEFGLGTLLGYPPERLLADYDPRTGGYLGLGMLVLLLAPWLVGRRRHDGD
ncbi:hypothetical protein [Vogesella alkaliphila]|uniref:Uncharacterized protein n=1 Tax=Vogesella alkaliphila TaxID=1193621 RepID=A0ABQ2YI95_9NEIS|nr:hypothetical protein [Vogesella alkaliphila]GGX85211.1 hypothetical protein GCM10011290_10980 [Vogesella alkaliphila]